jgi:hypothetical protein
MKGVLLWLVRWTSRVSTRDFCSALATLVRPVQKNFPHHSLFHFICPHRKLGTQSLPGHLSLNMCLW